MTKRKNATATAKPGALVHMFLDRGNHKLAMPLPGGERVFSLREHLTVSSFVEDLLAEDKAVKSVAIFNKHGQKVSKGTPIQVLLNDDWTVRIDGAQHHIKSPPRSLVGSQYVSIHPDLAKTDAKLASLKTFFETASKGTADSLKMSLGEYIQFAEDKGISKDQAIAYLRTLHKLGNLLFFEGNVELEDTIILNPRAVASSIERALRVPELKSQTKASLEAQLEGLKKNLAELQGAYESIDAKSSRGANFIMYSVLGGLLFQWLLFARFTWWDFSWDVMEPVTYFTMTAELSLGGYLYYLWQGSEFANVDMWTILYNWRFRRIARGRGFDIQKWNDINNGIVETQKQILHHSD